MPADLGMQTKMVHGSCRSHCLFVTSNHLLRQQFIDQTGEDCSLRLEIEIDGLHSKARLRCDGFHRRPDVATIAEQAARHRSDLPATQLCCLTASGSIPSLGNSHRLEYDSGRLEWHSSQ